MRAGRPSPLYTDGFAMPGTECGWYGIICSSDQVTGIDLDNNLMTGVLPSEIENLQNLNQLLLYGNQINGSLPPQLGNLQNLAYLDLYSNQFSGDIPSQLGALSSLTNLLLGHNRLMGAIPPELGNLSNLVAMDLSKNQLAGSIPGTLINLTNLGDSQSDFKWNALYTTDNALRTFLNSKQNTDGDWESTQTVRARGLGHDGLFGCRQAGVDADRLLRRCWWV